MMELGVPVDVKDRVVVVTGAARGMGRAYVQGFLSHEARVVATDKSWSMVWAGTTVGSIEHSPTRSNRPDARRKPPYSRIL